MLASIEMTKRKDLSHMKFEVAPSEEPLGDILQNRLEQLGPALDDAVVAGYAAKLLQDANPVIEPTSRPYGPVSAADDSVTYEAGTSHFGPALDDEEAAGYMGHLLA